VGPPGVDRERQGHEARRDEHGGEEEAPGARRAAGWGGGIGARGHGVLRSTPAVPREGPGIGSIIRQARRLPHISRPRAGTRTPGGAQRPEWKAHATSPW
jgi:hypothetical protein